MTISTIDAEEETMTETPRRRGPRSIPFEDRVIAYTESRDGHLIWTGSITSGSTPQKMEAQLAKSVDGRQVTVNVRRWAWERHTNTTANFTLAPRCGEPRCIEPLHQVLTTRRVRRKNSTKQRATSLSSLEATSLLDLLRKANTSGLQPIDLQQTTIKNLISRLEQGAS